MIVCAFFLSLRASEAAAWPDAPSNLSASAVSSNQLHLSWNDNSSNEAGFRIQQVIYSSGQYTVAATYSVGVNTKSYEVTGLGPSTTYSYRVYAYNWKGTSSYSNVASATTMSDTDTTPNPFAFTDVTGTPLSTVVTSNTITVSGINAASPIAIAGGTYSVNGGAYTSAAGTVNNGATVTVRVTSSASY